MEIQRQGRGKKPGNIMDWIEARLGCSLDHAWMSLREKIRSDLMRWRELEPTRSKSVESSSDDSFIAVSKTDHLSKKWTRVEINTSGIVVKHGNAAEPHRAPVESV